MPVSTSITTAFLVEILDQHGQASDELLRQGGVDRSQLQRPDCAIELQAFRELWARCAKLLPDIGLRMVEHFPPGRMHLIAHLAVRSKTVAEAIAAAERHLPLSNPLERLVLAHAGSRIQLRFSSAPPDHNPWMAEHVLSMCMVFLSDATARALPLRAVRFEAPRLAEPEAYLHRFGLAPEFDAGENSLEFDAEMLSWPLTTHDVYLQALFSELVEQQKHKLSPETPAQRIRDAMTRELTAGRAVDLAQTCRRLGYSEKRLRRELATEEHTFRSLLDQVRRDLARWHLDRGLSAKATAYLLGYSEPAAFHHACKRWFADAGQDVGR